MSRKKKIILAAVAVLLIVALVIGLFLAFRPKQVTETGNDIIRNATTEIIEPEDGGTGFDIEEGAVHYSHGCILEPFRYPGWEAVQIDKNGKEEKMRQDGDKLFVTTDKEKKAFFASDSSSNTSDTHDMAYVFTAPRKVKVDIVLNVKVSSSGGDGVVAYAYRNDTDNCMINGTIVTSAAALEVKEVILEKGDRVYFRYNKNKTTDSDTGNFYARITFTELNPDGKAFKGEKFKISEAVVPMPTAGTNSFSHGSIKYADTYPFWSAVAISKSTGKETALVKEEDKLYIPGDTTKKAFFGSDSSAHPSEKYDMAYVYTMPCKAKINIALTAQVASGGGDGIVGYVYVNKKSNMIIDKTVFTAADGAKAVPVNNLILEKGDKIYFVYSMNKSIKNDAGNFYGKVTYVEINPKGNGRDNNHGDSTETAAMPKEGTNSFSHGSIKYADTYPYWSAVSISRSTGKETAMVNGGDKLYISGDTTKKAYFGADATANPSDKYDMAYVYTMPCRAKINIALTAKVNEAGGDGIVGWVYVNKASNKLIDKTIITNADGAKALQANNIVLEKGDKIYFRYNMNQSVKKDAGNFYGKITYVKINPKDDGSDAGKEDSQTVVVEPGTVSYSHGSLSNANAYPCWSTQSVELSSKKISDMITGSAAKTRYVAKDATAYVNADGKAQSSKNHDLLYVYTMPVKAKVSIVLNASVGSAESDGVVVYAYRNSTDNCIINYTKVTNTGNKVVGQKGEVILNKGDKIYFRLNAKETTTGDAGWFYAKITYAEINPTGDAFVGEAYKVPTEGGGSGDEPDVEVSEGTVTYGNNNIGHPDVYPNWSAISISDSTETAMVKDGEAMYVDGDTSKKAYLASNALAKADGNSDLAYVYTMPSKVKVDVELMTMLTKTSEDGIVVTVYADEKDNAIIGNTKITNGDGLQILSADNIILNKGTKLYFRLNKNSSVAGDEVLFQAKLTFVEIDPDGEAYKKITWKDMASGGTMSGGSYGTYYSHGSINNPTLYPYFKAMSISLADGSEHALVTGSTANTMYVATDSSAYLNASGRAQSSVDNDLVYVYTMPCKAKINIALNASVSGENSDGVVVYAYANDTSNCIINRTVVTKTSNTVVGTANAVTLDEGDKIYFRLNKKENTVDDAGYFYAKITYVNEEPDEEVFKGEELEVEKVLTWEDLVAGTGTNKGVSYSHGSISSPATYAHWETKSIDLATGEEKALVTGSTENHLYVEGDTAAYLNASGKAQVAANHDLVYVYTMPCKATIDIALNASVTNTSSDGVVAYVYANSISNCIINRTLVKNTSNAMVGAVAGVTLNRGDKIYFRLNKNGSTTGDAGYFYAKITYQNQAPAQDVYVGSAYEPVTWSELASGVGTNKGKSYSHGSISSPSTYAYWETKSIDLATGEEKALVTGSTANHMYVDGDGTAYFNASGKMQSATNHDLVYVYTMPCKAKINIALNASVTSGSDGVKVSCYVNDTSHYLIAEKTMTNTSNASAGSVNGVTLNTGDKIYFRVNKNTTTTSDNGMFYAAITFLNEAP